MTEQIPVNDHVKLAMGSGVGPIRTFDSGATRDTDGGKLDFTRALSPIVLERYVQYLDKHRKQPDGSVREFDNWKRGLPFRESFSSLGRHYNDLWKMIEGYLAVDNHGPCNIDDTLCAIIFNASTMLHERLRNNLPKMGVTNQIDRDKLVPGDTNG